jgi:hypothetical protein
MGQALPLPRHDRHDRKKIILEEDPRSFPVLVEIGDMTPGGRVGVEDAQGAFNEMPGDGDVA